MEFCKNYTSKNKSLVNVLNDVQSFITTLTKFNKGYTYNIDINKEKNEWIANMKVNENIFKNS